MLFFIEEYIVTYYGNCGYQEDDPSWILIKIIQLSEFQTKLGRLIDSPVDLPNCDLNSI